MSTIFNISDKIKLENENPYFLDVFTGSSVAFSLRKLSSSYTGSAVKVTTNGSDNADIGFDGFELDTASLETFANGGDAYVSTWYDQSGNANNAVQTSFSAMPKIVSNGSVILENGKPCILSDGIDDRWFLTTGITTTDATLFAVLNNDIGNSSYSAIFNSSSSGFIYHNSYGYNFRSNNYYKLIDINDIGNNSHLIFTAINSSSGDGYITDEQNFNYASIQNQTLVNSGYTYTQVLGDVFSKKYKGTSQELIFYTSYKDGEQDSFMSKGNKYYKIY